jgi:hypothetical protein
MIIVVFCIKARADKRFKNYKAINHNYKAIKNYKDINNNYMAINNNYMAIKIG